MKLNLLLIHFNISVLNLDNTCVDIKNPILIIFIFNQIQESHSQESHSIKTSNHSSTKHPLEDEIDGKE